VKEKPISAGSFAVFKLIEILDNHLNYKLFFDNWFSSPNLVDDLKKRGFQSISTVQINRVPNCVFSLSIKDFVKSGRGQFEELVNKRNNIVLVRWNDNKPVHLISSYTGSQPVQKISRWIKEQCMRSMVNCPKIVTIYNKNMGGVDLADMLASLYRIDRKSKKYYTRIVYYLLSVCVNNAWILHKKNNPEKKMLLREFILSVSRSLIQTNKLNSRKLNFLVISNKTQKEATVKPMSSNLKTNEDMRFDNLDHWPVLVKTDNERKRCKISSCKKYTKTKCSKCGVFLCLVTDRNCFFNYHHDDEEE